MSCLFDSVGVLVGAEGKALRRRTCDYLARNADAAHNGATFRKWVEWQEGAPTFAGYVASMRRNGTWGGAMEVAVLCRILQSDIVVHGRPSSRVVAESVWDSSSSARFRIHLTWDGGHYEPSRMEVR